MIQPIKWQTNHTVLLLDQTLLPNQEHWIKCLTYHDIGDAIKKMKIRGAPAIGVAAAMGIALGALASQATHSLLILEELKTIGEYLVQTRPTAINLAWAVERMLDKLSTLTALPSQEFQQACMVEALSIQEEDIQMCRAIGAHGATLIAPNSTILTHCNAGALATAGYGTALGVIRAAHAQGKEIHVFVDETRPFLQGSRLTAWELKEEGIPMTLITDNMAGHFIQQGRIQAIVVGADRICANGDTANKIGTYTLSVLAKEHNIPFYVAAPYSTFDFSLLDGSAIPIEERAPEEVTWINGQPIAPLNISVANPAFDVTPGKNITAIITEKKVIYPPYPENLKATMLK